MSSRGFKERFFEGVPRYEWVDTLGRGGMGIVYKAKDKELDEIVAIKVLQPDFDGTELDLLTRFKREINLNRKIKHPNVARIHDFGMSGEFPYITMEYIQGKDLKATIQDRGRIPPPEAISILRQIARGVQAAHEVGIIHRDLKPQNVMLDGNGAVAILDFGLARGRTNDNLTASSIVLGTPQYLSPEQALGGQADARSDIYSIGIIAFEMLTGDVPFIGDTPVATAMKQVTAPVPDSLSRFPDVSPGLRGIVLRALAKRPSDRFGSAAELESEIAMLEHRVEEDTESRIRRATFEVGPPSSAGMPIPEPPAATIGALMAPSEAPPVREGDTPPSALRRHVRGPQAPEAAPAPPVPELTTSPTVVSAPPVVSAQPPAAPQPVATMPAPDFSLPPQVYAPPQMPQSIPAAALPLPVPRPSPPVATGSYAPQPSPPVASATYAAPAPAPRPASSREMDRTVVRRRVPTVLVVDADSHSVLTSASVLESSGTQVVVARSGQEALELLMKSTVDLIFLDISLPGMDGLDVTRIIKSQHELANIPILLTSQRLDRSLFAFGIQLGAVDFIRKPIAEKTLITYAWQVLKKIGFIPPAGVAEAELPGGAAPRGPRSSY